MAKENTRQSWNKARLLKLCVAVAFVLLLLGAMVHRFIQAHISGPYTIVLAMGHQGLPHRRIFEEVEREFNATHDDVKFKVVWGDTLAKLPLLVAAEKMPDLWEEANFQVASKQNLIIDLEPYLQRDWEEIDGGDFYPELLEACRSNDRLNIIPRWYNVPVLTYRPSCFKEAGIAPPDESWTWEDYYAAGRKLVKRDENGLVIQWGSDINYGWWEEWLTHVRQAGGRMFDPKTGKVTLDTPEAIRGLEHWARKVQEGWSPTPRDMVGGSFAGGQYAMSVSLPCVYWQSLRLTTKGEKCFDWDIAPLPKGPKGRITGEMAVAGIAITRDCKRPEEAWGILKMLTSKRAIDGYIRLAGVPVRKSSGDKLFLSGTVEEREDPQHREALLMMLKNGRATPSHPRFGELSQQHITPRLTQMIRDMGRDRQIDVAKVAREITEQCNDVLTVTRKQAPASRWWLLLQAVLLASIMAMLVRYGIRRAAAADGKRRLAGGLASRRNLMLFGFISPWIIGFTLMVLGPMIFSFYIAQTDYVVGNSAEIAQTDSEVGKSTTYVGMANYWNLFSREPGFWHSLGLTATYAAVFVPISLLVALLAAMLLNLRFVRCIGIFRTIWFLPSLLPVAASTLMWGFLMHPRWGIFNRLIEKLGMEGPGWFTDPKWALWTLMIVGLWCFGGSMLIFLAGLQDVPRTLHEAAMIDGAGVWSRFRHVTIPCLSPVIFFNLVMGVIGAMQIFAVAYILTNSAGGAAGSLRFYVLALYEHAFINLRMGIGSAMAWLLFLIIVALTAVNFIVAKRWVHYQN